MGIRFACPNCGGSMNVKEHLAGRRGICKHCQGKVEIPLGSTIDRQGRPLSTGTGGGGSGAQGASVAVASAAPAAVPSAAAMIDPIAEAPALQWYVLPPGGGAQYGPAAGDLFRMWIAEGRVSGDALVWRQDWPEWRRAGDVLPQLVTTPLAVPMGVPAAAADSLPAAGVSAEARPQAPRPASGSVGHQFFKKKREERTRTIVIALVVLIVALLPLVYLVIRRTS
ncbi:MAG TPA: DUF4339 domain-containing protein [Pirellulales bacterium]|nr:DUF4339 domain-containing protein [Pirellulales bacterium]